MSLRGLVFGLAPGDFHRAGRTERSLTAAGLALENEPALNVGALIRVLCGTDGPILLARAGTWLAGHARLPPIPPSATGRPLVAIGALRHDETWVRHLARCGGDLQRRSWLPSALPEPGLVYLESAARFSLAALLGSGRTIRDAIARLSHDRRFRAVHLPALDAHHDAALRVIQIVTTIQVGGAERVTLDLAEELTRQHVRVCVAAFGRPTRLAFPEPAVFADLSNVPNTPADRADAVAALARSFGADLVHAHLIRPTEARAIKARGLPLAMTFHNMPPAWPAGLAEAEDSADFYFACSRAVETAWRDCRGSSQLPQSSVRTPVRTIWNGINAKPFTPTAELRAAAAVWRVERGWGAADFIVAAIANPRPQKRLHLMPAILRELQIRMPGRAVRLVFVGAHAERSAGARQAVAEIAAAIARCRVADSVHWTGGTGEVATILAASDSLVSASAYEGLSLAHLEALAAGVPVVATDVGGTAEIASPLLHLVAPDAGANAFAAILSELALSPVPRMPALPPHFARHRMATRTRQLYPRVIERARDVRGCDEVWLIANNFSIGGAQSSARRLLLGLAERGVKVRAFTVQEEPDHPTPGRAALLRAGVPVTAIPPPETLDAADAAARILEYAASAPPRAVLFWNLITSYKILLADGFTVTPIYDVSPGEMYFASLAKYFAEPRPGLPYINVRDYGARLAGVVVKYAAETESAAALGAPVHVIRNGVASRAAGEAVSFPCSPRAGARGQFVIGTAARLSPDKRLEDLLDAFRLALPWMPRCELRIAGGVERGGESYARELRRRARGLPVKWCGELPDTAAFLAGLDLFAMISEPAGCPNASLEALAAGLPVIATDVGGAGEQVRDGITGRLTPRGDAGAFAEALVELAHDAEKRARFGAAAQAHVREDFSLDRMIDCYRSLIFGDAAEKVAWASAQSFISSESVNIPVEIIHAEGR
jgi:glycosyltransferase involved in cell wall biosynthesis